MEDKNNVLEKSGETSTKIFNDGPLIQTKNMQYYDLFTSNSSPLPQNNSSAEALNTLNYDAFTTHSNSLDNCQSKQLKKSLIDDIDDLFESDSHQAQRTDSKNELYELFDFNDEHNEQKQTNSNLIDIFDHSNKQQTKNISFDDLDENSNNASSDSKNSLCHQPNTLIYDELFDQSNEKSSDSLQNQQSIKNNSSSNVLGMFEDDIFSLNLPQIKLKDEKT